MRFGRVIQRKGDRYRVRLGPNEREVVEALVGQLRELLLGGNEASVQRLFPPGYGTDEQRSEEYRLLTRDDLLAKQLEAINTVEQSASAEELDEGQLNAWMRAINSIRLVIGTQLDLGEEPLELDDDDPRAPAYDAYEFLGYLLHEIVEALAGW